MSEPFSANRPRKGQPVTYKGKPQGTVRSVDGNLCWVDYHKGGNPLPFIWRFKEGLNELHDWPTKNAPDDAPDEPTT